jgi:hypothetical protein
MGITAILGLVIVSMAVSCAVFVRCASEEWLRAFVLLARSLERPL